MQIPVVKEMEGRHAQSRLGCFVRSGNDKDTFICQTGDGQFLRREIGGKKAAEDSFVVYRLMRLVFAGDDFCNLSLDILICYVE